MRLLEPNSGTLGGGILPTRMVTERSLGEISDTQCTKAAPFFMFTSEHTDIPQN